MVIPHDSVLAGLEKKLGLPKLSQITGSLEKFPDAKQLKLIKDTLEVAERVSQKCTRVGPGGCHYQRNQLHAP